MLGAGPGGTPTRLKEVVICQQSSEGLGENLRTANEEELKEQAGGSTTSVVLRQRAIKRLLFQSKKNCGGWK